MTTEDQKLHPCAFFSWRLSPAERNYDIGNNKLLAVTLVLEDWRHWLGGTKQLFLVWTDQKNLEYVRKAKRLNSKCLVVLFPHHWPGSHNIKYDALSHQYLRDEDMVSILSISHLIAPLRWEIEERVKAAQEGQPGPAHVRRSSSLFLLHCSWTFSSGPTIPASPAILDSGGIP